VNSAPIFLTINQQPWISIANKIRILEWKIRMDILQYTARGSPPLSLDRITGYKPQSKGGAVQMHDMVARIQPLSDDGHAIKLARAAGICHNVSRQYEDKGWMMLKGEDAWSKVFNLIVDAVEGPGNRWVRTTGLDIAWKVSSSLSQLQVCVDAYLGYCRPAQSVKVEAEALKSSRWLTKS